MPFGKSENTEVRDQNNRSDSRDAFPDISRKGTDKVAESLVDGAFVGGKLSQGGSVMVKHVAALSTHSRRREEWFAERTGHLAVIHLKLVGDKHMTRDNFISHIKDHFSAASHGDRRPWSAAIRTAIARVLREAGIHSAVPVAAACGFASEDPVFKEEARYLAAYMETYWQGLLRAKPSARNAYIHWARDDWAIVDIAHDLKISVEDATIMLAEVLTLIGRELNTAGFRRSPMAVVKRKVVS